MKEFLVWPVSCFGHVERKGIMTLITSSHWGAICDDFTCTSATCNIFKPGWIDFLLNHSSISDANGCCRVRSRLRLERMQCFAFCVGQSALLCAPSMICVMVMINSGLNNPSVVLNGLSEAKRLVYT